MSEPAFQVPAVFGQLSESLDVVSAAVRAYMETPRATWPNSVAARERANEQEFAALPYTHPAAHTYLMPLQFLGIAQDHLTALAAVVRTPMTVMAALTVLRTLLVAASAAAYVAEPQIGQRERVRRALNFDLDSKTEQARMHVGKDDAETNAEFVRIEQRRADIARAAKSLGWSISAPATPKAGWPKLWWVGDAPPTEMRLLQMTLGDVNDKSKGRTHALPVPQRHL